MNLTPKQIIAYRYNNDFSDFGVPSFYFKPDQVNPHGVMYGDGISTRYPLTMKEINSNIHR